MEYNNKKRKNHYSKFIIVVGLSAFIIAMIILLVVNLLSCSHNKDNSSESKENIVTAAATAESAPTSYPPSKIQSAAQKQGEESQPIENRPDPRNLANNNSTTQTDNRKIIVLDPGHGISTSQLLEDELIREGYDKNGSSLGEWRHWPVGQKNGDCFGRNKGCNLPSPSGASCWYSISNSDRDKEPEINYKLALKVQEIIGEKYEVRMTRNDKQHPAFSSRIAYCYKNEFQSEPSAGDEPDAHIYVCLHSNAGGGRGTAYIQAGNAGDYQQYFKPGLNKDSFILRSNDLGKMINDKIVNSGVGLASNGPIGGEEALIAFCKSPVPVGYLEIGFYDNPHDLDIIDSDSGRATIAQAIVAGIDEYFDKYKD